MVRKKEAFNAKFIGPGWLTEVQMGQVYSTFLLISGEELTTSFNKKAVHVNGLNIPGVIEPRKDSTLLGTVQKNVDAVREVDGVPHINHPNYQWALNAEIHRLHSLLTCHLSPATV